MNRLFLLHYSMMIVWWLLSMLRLLFFFFLSAYIWKQFIALRWIYLFKLDKYWRNFEVLLNRSLRWCFLEYFSILLRLSSYFTRAFLSLLCVLFNNWLQRMKIICSLIIFNILIWICNISAKYIVWREKTLRLVLIFYLFVAFHLVHCFLINVFSLS